MNYGRWTIGELKKQRDTNEKIWMSLQSKFIKIYKQRCEAGENKNLVPIAMSLEFSGDYQELNDARIKFLEADAELERRGIHN